MKKSFLLVALVLLLIPTTAFASLLSVGPTAVYNVPIGDVDAAEAAAQNFDAGKISYGADLRLRILFLQAGVVGLVTPGSHAQDFSIAGLVTAGVNFDLGPVALGLGLGPRLNVQRDNNDWKVTDASGNYINSTSFKDVFMNAPLVYRLNADLNLGGITLGATYTIDSSYKLSDAKNIAALAPDFENNAGRFGVSVLFNFL